MTAVTSSSFAVANTGNHATPKQGYSGPGTHYVAPKYTKINVMGEWAHPDDDVGIIGPCGVWHQKYGTRCGVIQTTRGEAGGNAVGPQGGTDLGLQRENEDRVAHDRSGTVDMFYLDRVDFFYNQSAPLTQQIWDHNETLRRATRIVRQTQPDVFIGWTPTLDAGHGNHQQAGRLIWEAMQAAADPHKFPEQLTGPHALSTWHVKKIYSGGSTDGHGGTTKRKNCTHGFKPAADNTATVNGVWTGYNSPYKWPHGNVQKKTPGAPKIWEQIHNEGKSAYPTQSRSMYKDSATSDCHRFAMTSSRVPFQPNQTPDGATNPPSGRDGAILDGATRHDPGGLPLGTEEYLTFSDFHVAPGKPFKATLHLKAGNKTVPAGTTSLHVPNGWNSPKKKHVPSTRPGQSRTITFTLTPPKDAKTSTNIKLGATLNTPHARGYTDNTIHLTSAVEGRFHRWGKWKEYDHWLKHDAPAARRLGRSDAAESVPVGDTLDVPVDVTNRSNHTQHGHVTLTLPDNFTTKQTKRSYESLPPGESTTVHFKVKNTDTVLPKDQTAHIPITTSSLDGQSTKDTLKVSLTPKTTVAKAKQKPTLNAKADKHEYPGPKLDIGRIWHGGSHCSGSADCGKSDNNPKKQSWAKISWRGDSLYFFAHIRDDYQSYAVKPKECKDHWLADSVEFQIDPRGSASRNAMDTADTFKLGVFPYTNDPKNKNGNGKNGPCWERDADNHQGYSTGPHADEVEDAPNAAGIQVASSAKWVGDNQTTTDHKYSDGSYNLEVKVPMKDLPAAVDPDKMGLNITPYDNDDTSAKGSNKLRHIDQSTRLGWSAFDSVQSDPYRWGTGKVNGYTPPSDRSKKPSAPIVGHPNLQSTKSPQSISQSARTGVPLGGRSPAKSNQRIIKARPRFRPGTEEGDVTLVANGHGTARIYLYQGDPSQTPVWKTSCPKPVDPPPDYGLTACNSHDGNAINWLPDMNGHLLGSQSIKLHKGRQSAHLTSTGQINTSTHILISFEGRSGGVQALDKRPH